MMIVQVIAVVVAVVAIAHAHASNPWGLPDPHNRMFLGAYTELSGVKKSEAAIEQRERAMGRPYDLQVTYYDWNDPFPDFGE
ncbi:MAG: hypothetical protein ACRDRN_11305, partial [Sciscionella sp.]